MTTEITDKTARPASGWIYFDAQCQFCLAHRRRWGRIFERRGFVWLPLQTPGAARRLGITDSQLREEMWLELADGRKFRGVNAWSAQMRRVWWLWPLGVLLALPGCNAVAQDLYRWIARHRFCLGGTCAVQASGNTARPFHPASRSGLPPTE